LNCDEFLFIYVSNSVRAIQGVNLRPLAYWDCRFESRKVYGYLSLGDCCVW